MRSSTTGIVAEVHVYSGEDVMGSSDEYCWVRKRKGSGAVFREFGDGDDSCEEQVQNSNGEQSKTEAAGKICLQI